MNLREYALVAFTLLMQTSVGIVIVVTALQLFASRTATAHARPFDLPLLVATIASLVALLASIAHLGQPQQAWLALTNFRTSWLSREIVLSVLFAASAAATTLLLRREGLSPAVRAGACVAAAALGIVTIYAMTRVYMLPAQDAWNRLVTPASFFVATGVLGVVSLTVLAGRTPGVSTVNARWFVAFAIALLAVQVALLPAQVAALAREPAAAISAASAGYTAVWLATGKAAAALGAAVLLVAMVRSPAAAPALDRAGITALALVALSEIFGRILFYVSSARL